MTERRKAKYRLLVFGLIAVVGPSAFGVRGVFGILYSILLAAYALWALRLTVVFDDDMSLGYLLCLFDATIVVPLILWTSSLWLVVPMALLWVGGLLLSWLAARRLREELEGAEAGQGSGAIAPQDEATGFISRAGFVQSLRGLYAEHGGNTRFSLVVVRLERYQEYALLSGSEAAGRALGALARRVKRIVGPNGSGYRITDDRIALVVEGDGFGLSSLVAEARRSTGSRLVQGHKLEVSIGYATFPRDGSTPRELLMAAELSASARPSAAAVATVGSRLAMGS